MCHIWSSPQITFHVLNFEPECPDFLFTIKGLSTLREQEVFAAILDTWHNNETNSFLLSICKQAGNPEVAIMYEMLMDFADAVWTEKIENREMGNILAPSFRVFAPGALIPNAHTWCHLRNYLASRSYSIQHQSPGTSIKPSKVCTICYGADHPRGLCPFLNVMGWNGPLHREVMQTSDQSYRAFRGAPQKSRSYARLGKISNYCAIDLPVNSSTELINTTTQYYYTMSNASPLHPQHTPYPLP